MAEFTREVARRLFAQELRDSDLSFRENEDQYAPLYLITPTGARSNRVFVVGALVERDNLGDEVEYWRGRIVDPTGSILVYAGQYQPDAAQVLAGTEPPAFVAVVGKPSVYETEDGTRLISIRAESVQKVDAATKDRWTLDAAKRTLERIGAFEEFLQRGGTDAFSSGEDIQDETPIPADIIDIGKAYLHYETDLARYRGMVIKALESLKNEGDRSESDLSMATSASHDLEEGFEKEFEEALGDDGVSDKEEFLPGFNPSKKGQSDLSEDIEDEEINYGD